MRTRPSRASFMWEVDDGYCGGSAPQYTQVDESEIHECETLDDAVKLVEDAIENDFCNHATPTWDGEKLRKKVEEIWNQRPQE